MSDIYDVTEYTLNEDIYPVNSEQEGDVVGDLQEMGQSLSDLVHSSERTIDAAQNIAGMFKECIVAQERTKQMQEWGKVEMAKTIAKFKTAQAFMEGTFGERDKALTKHYELLDKAVATNDRDLILASLQGISSIVTKSPLDDFQKFVELYNDTSQQLLDF